MGLILHRSLVQKASQLQELSIAELLCNGINPETGEILNTPRNPKVDQARLCYLKALQDLNLRMAKEEKSPSDEAKEMPSNQGAKWTGELNSHLISRWNAEDQPTVEVLAEYFGRTNESIIARLAKLGVATDREEVRVQNRKRKQQLA